jgi:hypothetical protein
VCHRNIGIEDLSNVARVRDFVNKSVYSSHDLVCMVLISPLSCN